MIVVGAALMFALKPRETVPARLRAVPAFDVLAPLGILALFVAGGILLIFSAPGG